MPVTTKHVSILLTGSGEQRHAVQILRGVTVRDLLEQLGLEGHLTKFGETTPFGENEVLYPRIEDGDKLILGPNTPVAGRR